MSIKIRVSEEWDIVGGGGGSAGGSDKDIQFNDGGDLNGSENFTWNNTTNLLNINEKISINASGAFGVGASPDYGAIGKALFSQGSGGNPSWDFINNHAIDYFEFNAQGDYSTGPTCVVQTWTVPSNGTHALIMLWGGGGGASANLESSVDGGAGGGGGGCMFGFFSFEELGGSGTTIKLSVGDGGRPNVGEEEHGESGGTTTFGCDDSCTVGAAGTFNGPSYFMRGLGGGAGGWEGGSDQYNGGVGGEGDNGYNDSLISSTFGNELLSGGDGRAGHYNPTYEGRNGYGYFAIFGGAGGATGQYGRESDYPHGAARSVWGGDGGLGAYGNGQVPGGGGGGYCEDRGAENGEGRGGHGQIKIWIF